MAPYDKYDEYKFFVEDTAKLTDRRVQASNLYTSVNSLLIAVLTLVIKDLELLPSFATIGALLIIGAGIAICVSWISYIDNYRKLISLRFNVLKKMESHPALENSEKMYQTEEAEIYNAVNEEEGLFTKVEKNLPKIFIILYVCGFVGGMLVLVVELMKA